MNKKIFIPFIIISILLFGLEVYYYQQINKVTTVDDDLQVAKQELKEMDKVSTEEAQDKISLIKKRLALKGLISKGDIHLENKDYTIALTKYLQIYKKIPEDDSIIQKIGDSYFYLKKYSRAYQYYKKIKDPVYQDTKMMVFSLMYANPLTKENLHYIHSELKNIPLEPEQEFYYTNALTCVVDFSLCKKNFSDYFTQQEENTSSIINEDLESIKQALLHYENFQLDDVSYKNALVTGAFFENGLYPIAIETGIEILKEKQDYRPVLKIVAKSYFELGNYLEAKKILVKYNELGDNDAEISFFLGIVYEKLHDYVLSSIHLKKALTLGYENTINIRRRLIYNYYQSGNIDKMLKIFEEIIRTEGDNIEEQDINLAIYYHILNEKMDLAKEFALLGLKKYPENETFYGYMGWIYLQEDSIEGSLQKAKENLDTGFKINDKNPMINLISGKLEEKLGNNDKALSYFRRTLVLDDTGDFGKMAQEELNRLTGTGSIVEEE